MTTLSMRYLRGDFVVTGPDIEPVRFKTRREAWVWCFQHHPGSPVKVVGPTPPSERPTEGTEGGAKQMTGFQSARVLYSPAVPSPRTAPADALQSAISAMAVLFLHIGQSIAVPIGMASTITNATTVKLVANTMA